MFTVLLYIIRYHFTYLDMMTWLLAIIAPFILLQPLNNTEGTCTLDAYIHCKMRENKDRLQGIDYIEPVTQYRDRLREEFTSKGHYLQNRSLLEFIQSKGLIKEVYEILPNETPVPPFMLTMYDMDVDGAVIKKERWNDWNHSMCVVWETADYWIVLNDRWTARGFSGFGFVEKNLHAYYGGNHVYHYFR